MLQRNAQIQDTKHKIRFFFSNQVYTQVFSKQEILSIHRKGEKLPFVSGWCLCVRLKIESN